MNTRRQKKMSRAVKEAVSNAVRNQLSDPRIEGFVSVTRVEMSPDLRKADVYLSIFGTDQRKQKTTFQAVQHARRKIQSIVGEALTSKFCPVIGLHLDENFKKTIETINIIDNVTGNSNCEDQQEHKDAGRDNQG